MQNKRISLLYKSNKHASIWKHVFFVSLILSVQLSHAAVENEKIATQKVFKVALELMHKKDYKTSLKILKFIYKKTGSTRVQLEIARNLYLDKQFKKSKETFLQIQEKKDIPAGVKKTIDLFIDEIDKNTLNFSYAFGTSTVTNPTNTTFHKSITILGQTLNVTEADKVNETVTGVWVQGNANWPIDDNISLLGYVKYFDAPYYKNDTSTLGIGVRRSFQSFLSGYLELSHDYSDSRNLGKKNNSFLKIIAYPNESLDFNSILTIGRESFNKSSAFNSKYLDLQIKNHSLGDTNYPTSVSLGTAKIIREDAYNSLSAFNFGIRTNTKINKYKPFFESNIKISRYLDDDPFFLDKRIDKMIINSLGAEISTEKFYGLNPEFKISYINNDSSIDYYEYRKISLDFILKK